jgi:uncharacterized protein (DUF2336 family)
VLRLIAEAGLGHQEAVAGRLNIGVSVTDALARSNHESVLLALVRNTTAKISSVTYQTLVQKSRALTGLQEPLIHRPDLPPQLATDMCEWVSDALKTYIKTNYRVAPTVVDAALVKAKVMLQSDPIGPNHTPADSALKLIEKLACGGQLRASFLMRVLSQGQMDLFDLAFARLMGMDLTRFRHTFYHRGPRPVALACHAAGIDRSVFATVFNLSRQGRSMSALLASADIVAVEKVFASLSRQSALAELLATALS